MTLPTRSLAGSRQRVRKASILTNLAGQGVVLGAGLATGVILARGLGPSDRGAYVLLVALCSLVMVVIDRGRSTAVMTYVSRTAVKRVPLTVFSKLLGRRAAWAALAGVAIGLVALPLLRHSSADWLLVVTACCICFFGYCLRLLVASLIGSHRFVAANLSRSGLLLVHLFMLGALGLFNHLNLTTAATSLAIANAIFFLVTIAAQCGGYQESRQWNFDEVSVLERANRLAAVQLLETFQLDVLLLGAVSSTTQVGYYSVGTSVASSLRPIGQALGQPLHVHLAHEQSQGADARLTRRRPSWGWATVAVVSLASTAFGAYSLVPIVYGDEYRQGRWVAVVGVLAGSLAAIRLLSYEWLRGRGLAALTSRAELRGFFVMILVITPAIAFGGAIGAMSAVAVANAVSLMTIVRLLHGSSTVTDLEEVTDT